MDFDAIITGIRKAIYGREVREYIASSMEWTRDFVNQSIANIKELLRQAEAARDAAKSSQDAAKVSETNAKASENAAKASENAAASSASAAAGSASAAKTSETNAKASENAAKTSETKAKTSETNAKASENAAKTSETNAKTSETNAKSSETKAATSETNAKTSETNAKASADSMGTSVATCTAKAKEAEASAGKAAASEGNAKTSEGNAKASEDEARRLVEEAKKVVNTDKTLTIDGAPADAKTVGDKLKSIKTDWNSVTDKPSVYPTNWGNVSEKPSVYPTNWGNVSEKPSSYPPSAHDHYYLAAEGDNRSTATTPDTYNNFPNSPHGGIAFKGLKQSEAIGLNIDGDYAYLLGLRGWGDYTGGDAHEIAFTNSGIYVRQGATTSWGSWNKLNTNTIPPQTSGSDWIRFSDGTQICWGTISNVTVTVTGTVEYELYMETRHETISRNFSAARIAFPQAFSNTSYSVVFQNSYNVADANTYIGSTFDFYSNQYNMYITGGKLVSIRSTNPAMGKTTTGCTLNSGGGSMYVAVGRWK